MRIRHTNSPESHGVQRHISEGIDPNLPHVCVTGCNQGSPQKLCPYLDVPSLGIHCELPWTGIGKTLKL